MNALRLLLAGRWRQALATSLAVAALAGAIGGFVLASATAARRVDGSFRDLLREIDAPDLIVRQACAESVFLFSECTAQGEPSAAGVALAELVALEFVQQARVVEGLRLLLIDDAGAPLLATSIDPSGCGTTGRYPKAMPLAAGGPRDQAVPFRLEGQLPTPGGSGVVLARSLAERTRIGIGDTIRIAGTCGLYSEVQRFGRSIDLVVTGLSIGPADAAAPSTGITPESLYVDPVVFESLQVRRAEPETEFTIWLDPTADAAIVSLGLEPFEVLIDFNQRASAVDAALAVDARTLWLLAAIGVVGGILVLSPIVGRNIRATGPPTVTLSALGATQRQIAVQAAAHGATLAVVGAATASVLAIPLSAIMPRGRAAAILGDHQLSVDWLVTATGFGLTAVGVFVISCLPAWRISTARDARRRAGVQPTEVFLPALRVGPAARTGLQAAIGVSTGPRGSNPWASLLPLMLLATSGVASITYLAGLRHLERTPALVGWNWDALVGIEEADSAQVRTAISRIAATEGVDQVTPTLSFPSFFPTAPDLGLSLIWPWAFATGRDAITPQMLTGRAPEGSDEVAIDPVFARRTGVNVGDVIPLTRPSLEVLVRDEIQVAAQELGLPVPRFAEVDDEHVAQIFEVTGIAVLPLERSTSVAQAAFTLDGFWSLAPSADEITALRVWLPADLDPQLLRRVEEMLASVSNTEVSGAFVRYSGDEAAIHRALARIDGVSSVLAPAPGDVWRAIGINLDRADRIPASLAITVAGLFIALVAFHLFAAVRARRFEFAVMRALGMSTSGVCRSIAVQATITALVVVVVAIPAGVLVGRWAWLTNARDLDVEQIPVIPWIATASVGVGAVVIASVAALSLGWPAIRRTPATDLRFE